MSDSSGSGRGSAGHVTLFAGESALSDFRRDLLQQRAVAAVGAGVLIDARYCYFVHSPDALTQGQVRRLAALVHADAQPIPAFDASPIVVPRIGTRSPWSTKATEIAAHCGLPNLHRLERGIGYRLTTGADVGAIVPLLYDRMTQSALHDATTAARRMFVAAEPTPLERVPLSAEGMQALREVDERLGLALNEEELEYLSARYRELERDPTDAELMMFAQANSEHCRHKIFNASWTVDGDQRDRSLFAMIRYTHASHPDGVLSAYADNAAVIQGLPARRFWPRGDDGLYRVCEEPAHVLCKVETHNHPTAISPFPGAATGSGGEIRDEAATGRGARPKAGLTGFSVADLNLPDQQEPWESGLRAPQRQASALDIMIEGPIGAAAFNNEFGRPALGGYFRSLQVAVPDSGGESFRGYFKPIMVAGGQGVIRPQHVRKGRLSPGDAVIVLGGPAMLIGLGGGAASSVGSGASTEALDYASVQRGNPEMQRRCQEVIDRCWAQGDGNPIVSIHDVGAGGLSNAIPELLHDSRRGGTLDLRAIPCDEPGLSPMQIWSNEAQERYVLGVSADRLSEFQALCARERCPVAVLGQVTDDEHLLLADPRFDNAPVDLPMDVLFGSTPAMERVAVPQSVSWPELTVADVDLSDAIDRVLGLPAVAGKSFLITIGDRTVGGLTARDQMVGPWQVPVADAAVTLDDFDGYGGQAMAMGERTPLALLDAAASARMAVCEALTNMLSADIAALGDIKLSANWMAAAGQPGQDAALFAAVEAVGMELCPALGIAIPVGKDSLSMQTVWQDGERTCRMTAPLSLVVSAFAPIADVRNTLTPELRTDVDSVLVLVDLSGGHQRLGGSALGQCYERLGGDPPDVDNPVRLTRFFQVLQKLRADGRILAYHDRSDGGLLVTLLEMAFAGGCGLQIDVEGEPVSALFNEELGVVLQVERAHQKEVERMLADFAQRYVVVATPTPGDSTVVIRADGASIFNAPRRELQRRWMSVSHRIARLRDRPACADQEFERVGRDADPGLNAVVRFAVPDRASPSDSRPRVAILREQGVNGQIEMAAAFDHAGFDAVDVHMSDLIAGRIGLDDFRGIAACGGFSYGDVLGAGQGWAKSILYNADLREAFEEFFAASDRFALGVCNGCQMLATLASIIPGSDHWPSFERNLSEQYEARVCLLEVQPSPSVLLRDMDGARIPVAVAHGEGRAAFAADDGPGLAGPQVTARYVEPTGEVTEAYPANPNGSPEGIAGVTNEDGRVTILMPHPERVFRTAQLSWHPTDWGEYSPWFKLFSNAREWVG